MPWLGASPVSLSLGGDSWPLAGLAQSLWDGEQDWEHSNSHKVTPCQAGLSLGPGLGHLPPFGTARGHLDRKHVEISPAQGAEGSEIGKC